MSRQACCDTPEMTPQVRMPLSTAGLSNADDTVAAWHATEACTLQPASALL